MIGQYCDCVVHGTEDLNLCITQIGIIPGPACALWKGLRNETTYIYILLTRGILLHTHAGELYFPFLPRLAHRDHSSCISSVARVCIYITWRRAWLYLIHTYIWNENKHNFSVRDTELWKAKLWGPILSCLEWFHSTIVIALYAIVILISRLLTFQTRWVRKKRQYARKDSSCKWR